MAEKKKNFVEKILNPEKTGYGKVFESLGWQIEERHVNVPIEYVREALISRFEWKPEGDDVLSQPYMKMIKLNTSGGKIGLNDISGRSDFTMKIGPIVSNGRDKELDLNYVYEKESGISGDQVMTINADASSQFDVVSLSSNKYTDSGFALAVCDRRGPYETVRIFSR